MNDHLPPTPDLDPEKTAKFRALFFEEAAELLRDAERCLQDTDSEDAEGTLFRSIHSIKSGAAAFGMRRLVAFAHVFESALEELRRGSFSLDTINCHMFLRSLDMMDNLLQAEATQQAAPNQAEAELAKALAAVTGLASGLDCDAKIAMSVKTTLVPQPQNAMIRIELAKIDRLMNLAGELTILEGMLRQRAGSLLTTMPKRNTEGDSLLQGLDQLATRLRDMHEATMSARAQPLDNVFQRLPRLVRELAENLRKQVSLSIAGGEVEVDKTVIEQLMEPLTHILRNAIDHGIEAPDVRQAAGKAATGTIKLEARCIDSRLVMTITDDGSGLDLAALQVKAAALGYQAEGEAEVADLIFKPGLSTADSISEISGRGVGLDAVRHNLTMLDGTISVRSDRGQGTCFTLSLPLTLAVMDGMIVGIDDELYVLPLTDVQETLHVPTHALISRAIMPPLLRHQERYIPLVDSGVLLGRAAVNTASEHKLVVIVGTGIASAGLCIDQIIGQQHLVIRPVIINRSHTHRLGATILGDGRVALILRATQIMAALHKPRLAA